MGQKCYARACAATLASFAIAVFATAYAVDPLVMWDGAMPGYKFDNLTRTVDGTTYTLNLNPVDNGATPNTVASDSSHILIGNNNAQSGITLTFPVLSTANGVTVIMRCHDMPINLPYESGKNPPNRAVITLMDGNKYKYGGTSQTDNGAVLGVYKNDVETSGWIWKGSTAGMAGQSGDLVETQTGAFSANCQTIAFTYLGGTAAGAGSAYYVDGSLIQTNFNLKAGELATSFCGISFGGVDVATGSQFYAMKGMKIDAIAVFNEQLSAEQVTEFKFPSTWASEINAEFGSLEDIDLELADGAVVVGDTAFTATNINFICAGSITVFPPQNNATAFDFSRVTGDVTIPYKGSIPSVSGDTFTATSVPTWVTDEAKWTGTICISDVAAKADLYPFNLQNFGNRYSTVKLSAIGSETSKTAYLPNTTIDSKVVLEDDGSNPALRLSDGISPNCTTFRELAGAGTFTNINAGIYQGLTINVMTNFTGTLALNKMTVTFGTTIRAGRNSDQSDTEYKSKLYIDSDAILSVPAGFVLWSPAAVVIDGPVDFKTTETILPDGFVLLSGMGTDVTITRNASFTINGLPVEQFMCKVKVVGSTLQTKRTIGKRVIFR